MEGSISRKPVKDASNRDPSTLGLALSIYSDTQSSPTFGPPRNDDMSYFSHNFHLWHPSSVYPRTVLGPGNSYHENVAHSTLELDVNLTVGQKKRADSNKKKEMAKASTKADTKAGNDGPDDGVIDDEAPQNVSSKSRENNAYANSEIENALRIREPRTAQTPVARPDKECQTKVCVFTS